MQEEKQNSVDELIKKADEQLVEYLKSGKYKDFLKNMSNLHNYSITNQMLILGQRPNATKVKGMSSWNYLGRSVVPGEKGIKIIVPIIKNFEKENDNKEEKAEQVRKVVGFKAGYVFDYSQTQGKELDFFEINSDMLNEHYNVVLNALKSTVPEYTVQFVPNLSGGAEGMCAYKVKMISVKDSMPKEKTLSTLIHEIAHALTEKVDRSNFKGLNKMQVAQIKEVEAESVALVVGNKLGLNTEEFNMGYIANWSNENIALFRNNIEVIKKISSQILSNIEPQIQIDIKDLNKQKEKNEGEM